MPSFSIGQRQIAYEVTRSSVASERRITVTPGHVDVRALASDDDSQIADFLHRKRQWLFNAVQDMEKALSGRASVPRFVTGSRIPYRGRSVRLTVRRHDGEHVEISFEKGLLVDLPHWVTSSQQERIVSTEIKLWLKQRARRDVRRISTSLRAKHGLKPRAVRVSDMKQGWGACGLSGSILINWELIFAPVAVLEYVVAHEFAHLKVRSHGPDYWHYLGQLMPAYEAPKAWLDTRQGQLSSGFLDLHAPQPIVAHSVQRQK